MVGEVDWILEVVSPSSVNKDRQSLFSKYADARVREYWIVDARGAEIEFDINVLCSDGYRLVPTVDGWCRSAVFARDFRLDRTKDAGGGWQYHLLLR